MKWKFFFNQENNNIENYKLKILVKGKIWPSRSQDDEMEDRSIENMQAKNAKKKKRIEEKGDHRRQKHRGKFHHTYN